MNLFEIPDLPLAEELTTILLSNKRVRVERIISTGQTTDWYDQKEAEFVALLEGSAKIEYEDGETLTLTRGDTLLIEAHKRHRVIYTSMNPPCIWLCVFWN